MRGRRWPRRRDRDEPELDLFGHNNPPKRRDPESLKLYLAVLFIRSDGRRVYRAGRSMHLVDGDRTSTRALHMLAETLEKTPKAEPFQSDRRRRFERLKRGLVC